MLRMIRFVVIAVVLLVVVWLVAGLSGQVALAFGTYTLTTSLPVAILLLALLVAALLLILSLLALLLRTPSRISARRVGSRRNRSEAASLRALSSIAAGDAAGADLHARTARRYSGEAPLALYVAGEAARLNGRHDEANQHFTALAKHRHAGFLGWRGLVHHAGSNAAPEAAQLQARDAALAYPNSAWLRGQRVTLAMRERDYAVAARLATEPGARSALAVMASRTAADQRLAVDWAQEAVKLAVSAAPASAAPAFIALAEAQRAAGKTRAAQRTFLKAWRTAPHPSIAAAYLAPVTDPLERVQAAQTLTAANPDHPESALLLSRASIAARLPGEATRHTEAAARLGLDAGRLAQLRAELATSEAGNPADVQAAMQAVLAAPPGPFWRCGTCGTAHEVWQASCRRCEAIGSLEWIVPAAAETEAAPRLLTTSPAAVLNQ